jgi:glucokinase
MEHGMDPAEKTAAAALVADIGGTNARFALSMAEADGCPGLHAVREYDVARFGSLAEAAAHYLAEMATPPQRAVIAVASAVTGDEIKITNNAWSFSIPALQRQLGLEQVQVINDFAAVGLAIPHLRPEQLRRIGEAAPPPGRRGAQHLAALGPGTGLGVCRLLRQDGRTLVLETEGGHIGFAPADSYELAILQHLLQRYPRVSFERLVSGPGLCNLYEAVCAVEGIAREAGTPEQIAARALQEGPQGACRRSVERFCAILGSFAGDVALVHGAWDGVYLGGGLTLRLLPWIERGDFRRRFEAKGRFQPLLQNVPTWAITHGQAGLLGASARALAQ